MQPTIIFSLRNQQWLVIFSRLRCVLQPHGGATSNRIRIKRRCHQCCPHDIMVYNLDLKYVVQRCCKGRWVSVPCHQRWIQQVSVCLTPITLWLYRLKLKQVAVTGEKQEATDVMGSVVQPPLPPLPMFAPTWSLWILRKSPWWHSDFPQPTRRNCFLTPCVCLFAVPNLSLTCYIYKMSYLSDTGKLSR